mmetsp:Transcript_3399/g.7543  ORF Transcript_3399/g.7543 Transcript_3399/m.7543 type:complete len:331 (+) Transcript_3399:546-1538(+)
MIVSQQLGHKVDRFLRYQVLVLSSNELLPRLLGMPSQNPIKMRIQFQVIGVQVMKQFLGAQNFGNLDQLIIVVVPMEERFLSENHPREHASQTPHIQGIIILLQVHQKLRPLEITTGHPDIVLPPRMVKLRQPPINQPQLPLLVINHDVVRLDIPMHHTIGMAIIQRLEQLKNIIPNVKIRKSRVQNLEICIVDMLENEARSLTLRIPHHVQQLNDVRSPTHVLQDFDFAFDFFLLDGFEDFDDAFGVVPDVDAFEDFGVFAAADFADDFVIFLVAPVDGEGFVVPVVAGAVDVDVGVDSCAAHAVLRCGCAIYQCYPPLQMTSSWMKKG